MNIIQFQNSYYRLCISFVFLKLRWNLIKKHLPQIPQDCNLLQTTFAWSSRSSKYQLMAEKEGNSKSNSINFIIMGKILKRGFQNGITTRQKENFHVSQNYQNNFALFLTINNCKVVQNLHYYPKKIEHYCQDIKSKSKEQQSICY